MRPVVWSLGPVVVGLAVFEIAMQPSWAERVELGSIFGMMALVMATSARWLPRVARRNRSIKITVLALSLAAFSIVVGGVIAVGNLMFLSPHDLTLLLVVIAFGVVSAVGFAITVSGPLTADLDRLSDSATRVASGRLETGLALDRRDEVGRLSVALEWMVQQLDEAESARRAVARSRREFFAAVGHDLRTPLASMRAAVESIRDGVATEPSRQLEAIEQDVAVLSNLVEDIFLLARLDSGAVELVSERVDVTEIADETVEILRPLARRREVEVSLRADGRFLAIGHSESIGRVLRNLGDNAVRHAPPGTSVLVDVTCADGRVLVSVSDAGPGFDPEFQEVAFDRFSRSDFSRDRATGGSGLGLAIARSLVESMGGSIWIAPGVGGLVSFDLPASVRPAQPDRAAPRRRTSSLRRA